jgi:hypothetical protein
MNAFQIVAVLVLIVWMAWVSLTLIQTKAIAIEACGLAASHGEDAHGGIRLPVICPNLDYGEAKWKNSN